MLDYRPGRECMTLHSVTILLTQDSLVTKAWHTSMAQDQCYLYPDAWTVHVASLGLTVSNYSLPIKGGSDPCAYFENSVDIFLTTPGANLRAEYKYE